jgi:hypothetical protein
MGATIDFDAIATGTNPLAGHFAAGGGNRARGTLYGRR